jgi:threonine dehydrogenase-like Zn-dependent dehydrogenase
MIALRSRSSASTGARRVARSATAGRAVYCSVRRGSGAIRRPAPPRKEIQVPQGLTVVLLQPGKPLELETLPTPEIEPGGLLVKNTAAAICGSDLHYWRNDGNYRGPDLRRVPGHEFTGVVHSLGRDVRFDSLRRPLREGDRIAFPFFNPCNRCYWCVRGEHHACPHRQRRSMQFTLDEYPYCDGGYAEYYYLPPGHYVFKVPDVLPDEAIAPVNCALCQVLYGIEQAEMRSGDVVVIQGAGGLGVYAAAVAAERGASRVISIDGQPPRLELARRCGATDVIDMNEFATPESRVNRVKELTDGRGADVVVEVVGLAAATVEGLDMVRANGKYVDIGNIVPQMVTLPATKVITQQIKWLGVTHYDPWIVPVALDLLVRTRDRYPLSQVVSHRFPLAEVNRAFEFAEWQGKQTGTAATRVILMP